MPQTSSLQFRRSTTRRRRSVLPIAILAVALLPIPCFAQPSSGGAVQSIGGIAKSRAPEWLSKSIARPAPSIATAYYEMDLSCRFSIGDLVTGCNSTYTCGPTMDAPCLDNDPNLGGIDFVAAGTGLRNAAVGTIPLRGAPPGSLPVAAWLYWGAIVPADKVEEAALIEMDGKLLVGEMVGTTLQPCWKQNNLFVTYRSAVHNLIDKGVNGNYSITLVPGSIPLVTDGRNPWESANKATKVHYNGASLVAVYSNVAIPRKAQFFLHEGPHLLAGESSFRHVLDGALASVSEARHLRLGGDGQTHGERHWPVAPFTTLIGDEGGQWSELRGPNSMIDRHTDWQGLDGGTSNQLWDSQVTKLPVTALGAVSGTSAYWVRYESDAGAAGELLYDCVEVVAHALSLR